jgi:hypothetical protein
MPRSRSKGQSRKTVKLSQSLHRDVTAYALAAGAAGVSVLALSQPADAQIVYTSANERIGRNGQMLIDLNHDGTTDIVIREIPYGGTFPGNSLLAVTRAGGGVKMGPNFAAAMAPGSEIGSPERFISGAAVMFLATDYGVYYGASWAPFSSPRYLGIRFLINGETHYGWARLRTRINYFKKDIEALLTGYAYETQANTPIRAGDQGKNGSDPNSSDRMFLPQNRELEGQSALGTLALGAGGLTAWRREEPGEKSQ